MATTPVNGQFDQPDDLDFFRIDLVAGQRYVFSATRSGGTASGVLTLFDPVGDFVAQDLDAQGSGTTSFAFTAASTGTYFLRHGGGSGAYAVQAVAVAQDDHADLPGQAQPLRITSGAGTTVSGTLDRDHDQDYFRVELTGGQRYLFEMQGASATPAIATQLKLFDATGTELIADFGDTADPKAVMSFVPASTGVYYLLATNDEQASFGGVATGGYQLRASAVAADDHGDLLSSATPLALSTTVAGQFDLAYDQDVFRVDLVAGQRYLLTLNNTGSTSLELSGLQVLDALGRTQLVGARVQNQHESQLAFVPETSGSYYLVASNNIAYSLSPSASVGSFSVRASLAGDDDHADQSARGTALSSAIVNGRFDLPSDKDFFRVNLTAGERYVFELKGFGTSTIEASALQLYDPAGVLQITSVGLAPRGDNSLSFVAPSTGSYALLATNYLFDVAFGGGITGDYTVQMRGVARDDHPDQPTAGHTVQVGGNQLGEFDTATDQDVFLVRLNAGLRYLFELKGEGATPITAGVLQLIGPDGSLLGSDQVTALEGARFSYVATTTGDYALAAASGLGYTASDSGGLLNIGSITGRYEIKVSPLSLDDHADLPLQGSVLVAGTPDNPPTGQTINGTAGNDQLVGTSGNDTLNGLAGNDRLSGAAGNDALNGSTGIDTAVFGGARSAYALTRGATSWTVTALTGTDGVDTLNAVERIGFADTHLALDLDGHAGTVAKIIGALFGKAYLANKDFVGIGLQLMDNGTAYADLVQLALGTPLFAQLAGSNSNTDFVRYVYTNVVGVAPSAGDLNALVGLINNGSHTAVSLAMLACELDLNLANIDLVGLSQTGLAFTALG